MLARPGLMDLAEMIKLSKRLPTRQQALATAQLYIRRFLTLIPIRHTNPYLLITTSFYLACKMEECPQHIRMVLSEARQLWPEYIGPDPAKVGECEFWVISEMNSQLIVHHPYRTLQDLKGGNVSGNGSSTAGSNGFTSPSTEFAPGLALTEEETAVAWSIINDTYLTDLLLLHPPHVLAVTAIVLAVVLRPSQQSNLQAAGLSNSGSSPPSMLSSSATSAKIKSFLDISGMSASSVASAAASALAPSSESGATATPQQLRTQKLVTWLAESDISIEGVAECIQELVSLYEVWESYNEKDCKEKIGRFVKGRGLDK